VYRARFSISKSALVVLTVAPFVDPTLPVALSARGASVVLSDGRRFESATIENEHRTIVTIRHEGGVTMVSRSLLPSRMEAAMAPTNVPVLPEVEATPHQGPQPAVGPVESTEPAVVDRSAVAAVATSVCLLLLSITGLVNFRSYRAGRSRITRPYEAVAGKYLERFGSTDSGARFISKMSLATVEDDSWVINPVHRASMNYLVGGTVGQSLAVGLAYALLGGVLRTFSSAIENRGKTPEQRQLELEIAEIARQYSVHEKKHGWITFCIAGLGVMSVVLLRV
jgi:hypothetical protein